MVPAASVSVLVLGRARGGVAAADLTRPERPSRCTLPITALRVTPLASSPAIWLALRPSSHNFFSCSTRSSVQDIDLPPKTSSFLEADADGAKSFQRTH